MGERVRGVLVGLLILAAGAGWGLRNSVALSGGVQITATVTEIGAERRRLDGERRYSDFVRVRFTHEGQPIETTLPRPQIASNYSVGQSVEVVVDPHDPVSIRMPGAVRNWLLPSLVAMLGTIVVGMSLLPSRKRD